jgi:hypothetical protein
MTKISNNPTILLPETKYNGEIARIKKDMKYCVKHKEKICVFHFSLTFVSLGFNDSKALNYFGRFLIRGFAVGCREHRRV